MEFIFITLIVVAIVLFIASFFFKDGFKKIEDQFEEFSITTMQDSYQIKKRLQLLEDGMKTDDVIQNNIPEKFKDKPLLIQKVYHLKQHGYSVDDISKQTQLSTDDIRYIIEHNA